MPAILHPHALYNGRLLPTAEIRVSPFQTGYLTGWGLFSTLRVYQGVPFALEDHLERLRTDAAKLRVAAEDWLARVPALFPELIAANQAEESMARVYLARNRGGLMALADAPETDLLMCTAPLRQWGATARLRSLAHGRHAAAPLEGTKSLSWARNLVALEEAAAQGYDDALLLNERGEVTECTSANIFVVRGGKLLTPALGSGALPGVSRKALARGCARRGVAIEETRLFPADLLAADEVFITSTTREVQSVSRLDEAELPPPGAVTARAKEIFREEVAAYLAARRGAAAAPAAAGRS